MAGMFLAALDQTIVATSIRTIADDLQGLSLQAWATTAYLITATISTPLYGKLSDIYGRKPLFLTAISVFVLGSLRASFATSMFELAAFRAVQGLGAGGLFSLALAIVGDIVPPRRAGPVPGLLPRRVRHRQRARPRGRRLLRRAVRDPGRSPAGAGCSSSTCRSASWRSAIVQRVLNIPHTRRPHRIDWPGALLLAAGLVPLLILAEQGRTWGWTSTPSLALGASAGRRSRRVRPRRAPGRRRRAAAAAPVPDPRPSPSAA